MNQTKKYLWLVVLVALAAIAGFVYYSIRQRAYTAAVDIDVAPGSSHITIDGHRGHSGITHVTPGKITVVVTHDGFSSSTTTLEIKAKQQQYLGIVLVSNSAQTANWYNEHPEDQRIVEKIASKKFDISSKQQVAAEPFIKLLPYTGAGFEFKIDYGKPAPGTDKPVIIIQADTQAARDDALLWIKGQGFDPSTMNITYTTSGYNDYQD